jgi:hypothetical protein
METGNQNWESKNPPVLISNSAGRCIKNNKQSEQNIMQYINTITDMPM